MLSRQNTRTHTRTHIHTLLAKTIQAQQWQSVNLLVSQSRTGKNKAPFCSFFRHASSRRGLRQSALPAQQYSGADQT